MECHLHPWPAVSYLPLNRCSPSRALLQRLIVKVNCLNSTGSGNTDLTWAAFGDYSDRNLFIGQTVRCQRGEKLLWAVGGR